MKLFGDAQLSLLLLLLLLIPPLGLSVTTADAVEGRTDMGEVGDISNPTALLALANDVLADPAFGTGDPP